MKKNLLVTLADENYVEQAKQLFSSAYHNAGWDGDYLLLSHQIPEKKLKWFQDKGILIKKCKPIIEKKTTGKWPSVVFSKFYLFTEEFKKWDKVLFLDSDIIVRHSLDSLLTIKTISAVKSHNNLNGLILNKIHAWLKSYNLNLYRELKKKYNFNLPVFNSGMIIFDTKIITKHTFNDLNNLAKKYAKISSGAEELMFNLYFQNKWKALPEIYNVYPDNLTKLYKIKQNQIKGIILHFIINKPWNKNSSFYQEWKNNLKKSDKINLKKIPKKSPVNKKHLTKYLKFLEQKKKKYFYRVWLFNLNKSIDKYFGITGIFLKKYFPKTYKILKSIIKT